MTDPTVSKFSAPNAMGARFRSNRRRVPYIVLAIVTILTGLVVHSGRAGLGPVAQDVIGDALWAAMIAWIVGAAMPRSPLVGRSALAYVICAAVELSQMYHGPTIDALRRTLVGQLVLGSGFDARDLAAYAGGVLTAALLESLIVAKAT